MAHYYVGDKHYIGDPIGNITALKEPDNEDGLRYLALGEDTGSWAWGNNLWMARDYANATTESRTFETKRKDSECDHMIVVAVSDEDPYRIQSIIETPDKPVPARAEILREAERLITGDRNRTYGEPMENFENIARLFNTFLRYKLKDGAEITPGDTAGLMILVKLAREMSGPTEDNKLDIAGYAACWAEVDR